MEAKPPSHRGEPRMLSCIPAYVGTSDDSQELALILDISSSGAKLLTRRQFEDGGSIKLILYISKDHPDVPAAGKVVRARGRKEDTGAWPYEIAVQFDEPITAYTKEIQELGERQAELGLFRRTSKPPPAK